MRICDEGETSRKTEGWCAVVFDLGFRSAGLIVNAPVAGRAPL